MEIPLKIVKQLVMKDADQCIGQRIIASDIPTAVDPEIDIDPDDYANLFIVTTPDSEHAGLAHLRMPTAALAP